MTIIFKGLPLEMPILAEETVERARMEKDRQIFIAALGPRTIRVLRIADACPTGAYPVTHTVRGKGVVIPGKFSHFRRHPYNFSPLVSPQSTIPCMTFRNPAFIHTQVTGNTFRVFRRLSRQSKGCPALRMSLQSNREGLFRF